MTVEKSKPFANSVYNIMLFLVHHASTTNNQRVSAIAQVIHKYLKTVLEELNLKMSDLQFDREIHLEAFFEYMHGNNIIPYDLLNMREGECNIHDPIDFERFVLSNIHAIVLQNAQS
jgi:hypothetical protein